MKVLYFYIIMNLNFYIYRKSLTVKFLKTMKNLQINKNEIYKKQIRNLRDYAWNL